MAVLSEVQSALRLILYFSWCVITGGIIVEHGCTCQFAGINEEEEFELAQEDLLEVERRLRNKDYVVVSELPPNWREATVKQLKDWAGLKSGRNRAEWIARLEAPDDPQNISGKNVVLTKDKLKSL